MLWSPVQKHMLPCFRAGADLIHNNFVRNELKGNIYDKLPIGLILFFSKLLATKKLKNTFKHPSITYLQYLKFCFNNY